MSLQNRADRRRADKRNMRAAKGDGPFVNMGIVERIGLLNLLPKEGNALSLKIIRDLNDELGLTEEELKEGDIKTSGATLSWNVEAVAKMGKDVTVGPKALEIIQEALRARDKKGNMGLNELPIFERFVEGDPWEVIAE